jgi:tRNA dimethylallyltransferase
VTRHLALVGPTASGKSALAMGIARAAGDVEIVSLDSMQVYRGLDIGTAKPTRAERAEVRHHLVDVAPPSEEWSVRRTQLMAREALADIEARDRRALLVGGTGLYVRAVVDDLEIPPTDPSVRDELARTAGDEAGLALAYERLADLDPDAAARMERGNRRRIVRALEVIELTGRRFSSFGPGIGDYPVPALSVTMLGLQFAPAVLAERIEARFLRMRDSGLVQEVQGLAEPAAGRALSRTASEAIGYREVLAYLAGEITTLADAFDAAVRRTRRFARRQRTWFGRDPRVRWVDGSRPAAELVAGAMQAWRDARAVEAVGS